MIGPRGALSAATFLTSFSEQNRRRPRTFNYCIPLSAPVTSIRGNSIFHPRPFRRFKNLKLRFAYFVSSVLSARNAARAGPGSAAGILRAAASARVPLRRL